MSCFSSSRRSTSVSVRGLPPWPGCKPCAAACCCSVSEMLTEDVRPARPCCSWLSRVRGIMASAPLAGRARDCRKACNCEHQHTGQFALMRLISARYMHETECSQACPSVLAALTQSMATGWEGYRYLCGVRRALCSQLLLVLSLGLGLLIPASWQQLLLLR